MARLARPAQRRRTAYVWAGFVVAAFALLALSELTNVDMLLQHALFDRATRSFVWRGNATIEYWLHLRARQALFLLPAAALFGWLGCAMRARRVSAAAQRRLLTGEARRWRYLFVAMLLAPAAVSLAKQLTNRPCPWDLAEFGGPSARQHGLFRPAPPDERALACFPAGHASGGFALFAVALAGGLPGLRTLRIRTGTWFLVAAGLGLALGAIRVAQGAHFLSHVLWSAWLVLLLQWLLARWLLPRRAPLTAPAARAAPARPA